jgi:hypothetical protein
MWIPVQYAPAKFTAGGFSPLPSSLAEYPQWMDMLKRAIGNNKRNLLLAVALLASTLYVWQTASAWQDAHIVKHKLQYVFALLF